MGGQDGAGAAGANLPRFPAVIFHLPIRFMLCVRRLYRLAQISPRAQMSALSRGGWPTHWLAHRSARAGSGGLRPGEGWMIDAQRALVKIRAPDRIRGSVRRKCMPFQTVSAGQF